MDESIRMVKEAESAETRYSCAFFAHFYIFILGHFVLTPIVIKPSLGDSAGVFGAAALVAD